MTIKVGDKVPSVKLWQVTPDGVKDITTDDLFRGKRVASQSSGSPAIVPNAGLLAPPSAERLI